MEISITDFNSLAAEMSRRDVQIERLKMELKNEREEHKLEMELLCQERNGLREDVIVLQRQVGELSLALENVCLENSWIKQYILLSAERVHNFFACHHDFRLLAGLKCFVLETMDAKSTDEQKRVAAKAMTLPTEGDLPTINHADQVVLHAEQGAQVIHEQNTNQKNEEKYD